MGYSPMRLIAPIYHTLQENGLRNRANLALPIEKPACEETQAGLF